MTDDLLMKFEYEKSDVITFEEVVRAYFDCRINKRNSYNALNFEYNLEKNLYQLYLDLISGNYKISQSVVFVVDQPKIREIWAASFRDRVVHHIIYNRVFKVFYLSFIRDSFACMPGRGVLDGSLRLESGMRSISHNFQKKAYYLKADIRNFFVSIDKHILFEILKSKIQKSPHFAKSQDWLLLLIYQVVMHDPRIGCIMKSKPEAFNRVPKYKSLWHNSNSKGLPIGNLTSQFFANVYLNEVDQFVKHQLKEKYYYRYVDDFVILNESPEKLNYDFYEISKFVKEKLSIELHPFKKRIAPINLGIDFIGYNHKPFYKQVRERTAKKMISQTHQWLKNPKGYYYGHLQDLRNSMNSYFGIVRHAKTYNLRKHLGNHVNTLFIHPDQDYLKLIIPKNKK